MARSCICWLACCSLLLPFSARAADEPPVSSEFFLQSIEPEPSVAMLYDFLDIYGKDLAACKDTDTYLRALSYLAANGDTATVRDRLKSLESCTDLSEPTRQRLLALQEKIAEPRPPVAEIAPVVPVPSPELTVSASPMPTPSVSEPSVSEPSVSEPQVSESPLVAATPVPQPTQTHVVASRRTEKTKKTSHTRRTSLPVTPSIPIAARIVPSTVPVLAVPVQEPVASPHTEPVPVAPKPRSEWHTEVSSRGVYRTGDEGTSRLFRLENTASLGYDDWTFSATALYLNAGHAGGNEFTGSYFRGNQQQSLLTEQAAFIPQIAYDGDTIDFFLGTTPLGGEVAPLPTFRLSYTAFNKLKLTAFQESVTDSLLSYTGFRDPFTGQRMGRVMKTGMRLGWDDTFADHWFYGGAATGAYLYGENVKDNTQGRGEFYLGRTFGPFALGSYSAVDHYRTNLNNYTFGHGGYYSPYLAATSVLFASWEYVGKAGRIKADISSGFLYEKTQDSELYYGTDGPEGSYQGETHHRITTNAGLEGSLNITESLYVNASLRAINAGNFTETRGALYLKWMF